MLSHIGLLPIQIWIFFCLFFLLCINILTDLATIEQSTTQNDNNHNLVRARTYSYCKLRGRNTNGNCFKRSIDRPFAHTASNSSTDLYWNKLSWHHAPHAQPFSMRQKLWFLLWKRKASFIHLFIYVIDHIEINKME